MINEFAPCLRTDIDAALARLPADVAALVHAQLRRVAAEALRRGVLAGSSIMLAGLDAGVEIGSRVDLGAVVDSLLLGLSSDILPAPAAEERRFQTSPQGRVPPSGWEASFTTRLEAA